MTIKRVRNCTPHPVRILLGGGEFVFEPSGDLARIETDERCGDALMGIPVSYVDYGRVSGLPDEEEDTALIVSQMVAQELEERDSAEAVLKSAEIRLATAADSAPPSNEEVAAGVVALAEQQASQPQPHAHASH